MSSQQAAWTAAGTASGDEGVRRVAVNGIEIAYEAFGDPSNPPIVLVMGLGTQMLAWPDAFCHELADAGHHVVRFDNRDAGLSSHLRDVPPPRLRDFVLRNRRPPYRIEDMADDAAAVMDALGLEPAHVVGASMGGFIAQTLALRQPDKLRSLTLLMTSTGSRRVGRPHRRVLVALVLGALRRRQPADREEAVSASVEGFRLIASPGYPFDEERHRDLAERSYDRGYDPDGQMRQVWAISVQTDRTRDLASLRVPTLVMHGLHDPLVDVSGGLAVARAIPTSTFVGFPGMGHDFPRQLWGDLVWHILALTATADEQAQAAGARGAAAPTASTTGALPARWRRALRRRR